MTIGASLLTQIPMPTTQSLPKSNPIASIKVGDVTDSSPQAQTYTKPENKGLFNKIKNMFVEYRMKKIAQKAPELRTPIEQAEYEANQKSLICMV